MIEVTDIDFFENDAILVVDGKKYYFQFSERPTVVEALAYLSKEGVVIDA